jgi:ATP-dependent Lon protease
MQPSSAEYTVTRTYLEWLVDLPWGISTEDRSTSAEVRDVPRRGPLRPREGQEAHPRVHGGAQAQGRQEGPDPLPARPARRRQDLARPSIARAIGRKFVRISLGGVRDEAEIRGHRRTYVGALPGRIIQGIKKAGTNNPVFVLDEIDKLGHDFRGDPASALLEVLDPEQNNTFSDHYLEVPFDLSKVMFIATANSSTRSRRRSATAWRSSSCPATPAGEAGDRAQFLLPKQLASTASPRAQLEITDDALLEIIDSYTREAGVRNLERESRRSSAASP